MGERPGLRLRERGRMGECRSSSSVMLSELKCLVRKCSSSAVGWKGSWCSFSWDEQDDETVELGVLVPYPEEGSEARDQRLPSVLRAGTKEKCAAVLGEKFLGLSRGLLPGCPCSGECGLGSVGEVLDVTIRLFLLLVRQKLPLLGRLSSFCRPLRLRILESSMFLLL